MAAGAGLAWFAVDDAPLPGLGDGPREAELDRARGVLRGLDPGRLVVAGEGRVRLGEADLDLAVGYLLRAVNGTVRVKSGAGRARVSLSLPLPQLPWPAFLNLQTELLDSDGPPVPRALRIGVLRVPETLTRALVNRFYGSTRGRLAVAAVERVRWIPGEVVITYRSRGRLVERVRELLAASGSSEALAAYHAQLALLHERGEALGGTLADALEPFFALAAVRSGQRSDPTAENRALLLVLAAWAAGQGMEQLVSASAGASERVSAEFALTLGGRTDLAQHFLIAAALGASGDEALADRVALLKEVGDAVGGSGFSFVDLAAGRAGGRFGALAVRDGESARRLQERVGAGVPEAAILPALDGLPERLDAGRFQALYGEVGSPAYDAVVKEIERRLAAVALYRN